MQPFSFLHPSAWLVGRIGSTLFVQKVMRNNERLARRCSWIGIVVLLPCSAATIVLRLHFHVHR